MGIRRVWWMAAKRWWALCLMGAILAVLGVRVSVEHEARAHFPHAQPQVLAHLLADFSHQPNVGAWSVVEDHSNYTTWSYVVTYECGARCIGQARVRAHDEPRAAAPEHGAVARQHRVELTLQACTKLPLLPWPSFCDYTEILALVTSEAGAGARLAAQTRARCPALAALTGACGARLREHVDSHLLRVRAALDERATRHVPH